MTHIMIDIETLGTRPGAAIVSMAAVAFDSTSLLYGQEMFWRVEVNERDGLHIEPGTVAWWMTQSDEARAASFSGYQISLRHVLSHLDVFVREHGEPLIWAHGASFDPVLLSEAAHRVGGSAPWSYKALRDTRTLFDLAGINLGPEHQMPGHIAHHPLHDCRAQAVAVIAALHRIRSTHPPAAVGGVTVKALVWNPVPWARGAFSAQCSVGRYELSRTFDGLIASLHSAEMHHIGEGGEDHLKALCQADFERRINADLLPVSEEA